MAPKFVDLLNTNIFRQTSRYKSFTCNYTFENHITYVNYFNSLCEIKLSYKRLIFISESPISYVKEMFRKYFTCENVSISCICEIKVSCVEMFQFHMSFTCEITCEIFVRVGQDLSEIIFFDMNTKTGIFRTSKREIKL